MREQDSKIAQLEQEREWLREENNKRKSTPVTTDKSVPSNDK
jgi:hypothetical protein